MRQAGVVRQALGVLLGRALLAAGLVLTLGSAFAVDEARLLGAHRLFDFPLGDAVIAFGLPD